MKSQNRIPMMMASPFSQKNTCLSAATVAGMHAGIVLMIISM